MRGSHRKSVNAARPDETHRLDQTTRANAKYLGIRVETVDNLER